MEDYKDTVGRAAARDAARDDAASARREEARGDDEEVVVRRRLLVDLSRGNRSDEGTNAREGTRSFVHQF